MQLSTDSIFRSAIRSFCKTFFAVVGVLFGLFLCSILYALVSGASLIEQKTTMHLLPDASGSRNETAIASPAILQINVHGVIGDPNALNTEIIENILLDSRSGLLGENRVKGILLHFDTPGGTVVDSHNIYEMLKNYKAKYNIPVFGFVDGLCASGGMYIASAADKMFSGPAGIIGSVGVVIGPFFNVSSALTTLGIQAKTITEGLDKDMMNPTRPWKENEDASLKAITAFFYNQFVDIVAQARKRLDKTALINTYGAQVFDPIEAEKLGYIDVAMSSRNEALLALLDAANIDPAKPYQVVSLSPIENWVSALMKGNSSLLTGKIEHRLDLGQPKIQGKFAYLYNPESPYQD